MAHPDYAENVFNFAAAVAQLQAGAVFSGRSRVIGADPTEPLMHDVHEALKTFETAIAQTCSPSRLKQLEERAAAFAEMWASVQETARDKGLAS